MSEESSRGILQMEKHHFKKKLYPLIRFICGEINSYRVRFHMSAFLTRLYQAFARHLSLICGGFYGYTFIIIIRVQFYFFWNSSNLATVSENFFVLFSPPDCFFCTLWINPILWTYFTWVSRKVARSYLNRLKSPMMLKDLDIYLIVIEFWYTK